MNVTALIVPLLFLGVFGYALTKKIKLYDCFVGGVKEAVPLVIRLFPFLAAILMLSELFSQSGLSDFFARLVSPVLNLLGVPTEVAPLILMKPFSGSGSTALLSDLLSAYGADSYLGRCACVCYGSSETVFYISAVYFAGNRKQKLALPVAISLLSNLFATVFGCFLCRFL